MPKAAKPHAKRQLASQKETKPSKKKEQASTPKADIASPLLLKRLADNDENVRNEAIASVTRLLSTKRLLDSFDLQKLWKGLWFAMWHSDTPVAQQQLARGLADLFQQVHERNYNTFVSAFWTILLREWGSLDRYRINKFYLLVRLVLNSMISRLAAGGWQEAEVAQYASMMVADDGTAPLSYGNPRAPHSLRLHLIDIYADELDKVFGDNQLPSREVIEGVLQPVLSQLEFSEFKHIKQRVREEVVEDERVATWRGLEPKESAKPAESEDDDSDWEGFD